MQFEPLTGKNVIAYLRVSTKEQRRKGNGLQDQREFIDYLIQQGDHTLIDTVVEAKSAGSIVGRPVMEALIERVSADPELYIIVQKADRLVRNQLEGHQLLHDVNKRVIFGDIPVAEPMVLAVYFAMAETELVWIRYRTKRGIAQARKKRPGNTWGRADKMTQAGRQAGGDAKRDAALRDPNNIRAYNLIKGLRNNGVGWRQVATQLNDGKFKTSRGNKFSASTAQSLYIRMAANEEKRLAFSNQELGMNN